MKSLTHNQGTFIYLPPELKSSGPSFDISALGITIYQICCLEFPFDVESKSYDEIRSIVKS